ncbi:MAG: CBS domain-containing protein [Thermoplasmatota archaeon]
MALTLPTAHELKALRTKLGLTQSEVARAAGVSQPLIARIERGTVDPRMSTLRSIVDALNRAERQEVTLRHIMTQPVTTVRATDTVSDAIRVMREKSFSQLPVVSKGVPVGSLSERSVVHALSIARDAEVLSRSPVKDVMGPPFATAEPTLNIEQAYAMLEDQPAILVMERGRLLGIVAKADLLDMIGAKR